jgi:hypothetical protein
MLPTYHRSATYLPAFIDSAMAMSDPNKIMFVFCVNINDTETLNYINKREFGLFKFIIVAENLPKPNLAKYFNMMYDYLGAYYGDYIVSMLGDDMEFRTPGWDATVLNMIHNYNGIGVFWCNDDYIAHERCPVNMFVTRKMVEATGRPFMVEKYEADMIDYIWGKIGKYTGTSHYMEDIHIYHNHSTHLCVEQRDETFIRLARVQDEAHKIGKPLAKQIAHEIADILNPKIDSGELVCGLPLNYTLESQYYRY